MDILRAGLKAGYSVDQLGDCVAALKGHLMVVWRGFDLVEE